MHTNCSALVSLLEGVCLSLYCGGNLDSDDALRIYSRVREALGTSVSNDIDS